MNIFIFSYLISLFAWGEFNQTTSKIIPLEPVKPAQDPFVWGSGDPLRATQLAHPDYYVIRPPHNHKTPLFPSYGPSAFDVSQGGIGDAYFLANLAALAYHHPEAIISHIMTSPTPELYGVKFYYKHQYSNPGEGLPVVVLVNDHLVWNAESSEPAYAQISSYFSSKTTAHHKKKVLQNHDFLWVALYEKAYAIYRTHYSPTSTKKGFDALVGGTPAEAYEALTGRMAEIKELYHLSPKHLYEILKEANDHHIILALSRVAEFPDGIVNHHSYVVLGITKEQKGSEPIVSLLNPWGHNLKQTKHKGADGQLEMTLSEFMLEFQDLMIGHEADVDEDQ